MNKRRFKKGEIVSATKTFNGEIITGEFRGYHLFNDEIPDTVVGIVDVPGDGVYDVDVTSLRHCVKSTRYSDDEDEKITKAFLRGLKNDIAEHSYETIYGIKLDEALAWFEKQKEASKAIEAVERIDKYIDEHLANAHDMKDSNPDKKYYRGWDDALGKMAGILQDVYSGEKQKEQDKCPEYCVRSHCIGCPIYEKQKPSIFPPGLGEVHWNPIPSGKDVHKWNLPEDFEEAVYKVANFISPFDSQDELRRVSHRFAEQLMSLAKKELMGKPVEWNKATINGEPIPTENQSVNIPLAEWSKEDEKMLNMIEYRLKDWDNIKAQQGYQDNYASQSPVKWIESLSERFNLQPKQERKHTEQKVQKLDKWSKKDKKILQSLHHVMNCADAQNAVKRDGLSVADVCNFLFSIEPNWKPSEEQIDAVRYFVNKHQSEAWAATGQWKQFTALRGLLGDLLKLI